MEAQSTPDACERVTVEGVAFRLADAMTADDEPIFVSSARRRCGFWMKWSRRGVLLLNRRRVAPAAASATAPIVGSEKYGLAEPHSSTWISRRAHISFNTCGQTVTLTSPKVRLSEQQHRP
jgi:hypothetical protein